MAQPLEIPDIKQNIMLIAALVPTCTCSLSCVIGASYMTPERNSKHLSRARLLDLAAPSLVEEGYVTLSSVLRPDESAHFRQCSECIDALASIVRDGVADRQKKKIVSKA